MTKQILLLTLAQALIMSEHQEDSSALAEVDETRPWSAYDEGYDQWLQEDCREAQIPYTFQK